MASYRALRALADAHVRAGLYRACQRPVWLVFAALLYTTPHLCARRKQGRHEALALRWLHEQGVSSSVSRRPRTLASAPDCCYCCAKCKPLLPPPPLCCLAACKTTVMCAFIHTMLHSYHPARCLEVPVAALLHLLGKQTHPCATGSGEQPRAQSRKPSSVHAHSRCAVDLPIPHAPASVFVQGASSATPPLQFAVQCVRPASCCCCCWCCNLTPCLISCPHPHPSTAASRTWT